MKTTKLIVIILIAGILFAGLSRTGEDKFIKDEVITGTVTSKYTPSKHQFILIENGTGKIYRVMHHQYMFDGKYRTEKNDKMVIVKSYWKSGLWGDHYYKYTVKSYNGKPLKTTRGGYIYDMLEMNPKDY